MPMYATLRLVHIISCDGYQQQDILSKQEEYTEALEIARRVAQAHEARLGPVRERGWTDI